MKRLTDAALMTRTANGDHVAFAEVHRRHAAWAVAHARRAFAAHSIAPADIAQDAFIELWRTAARFDAERGALRPWLGLIVRHRGIDALRRLPRHEPRDIADYAHLASDGPAPHVLAHRALMQVRVARALTGLPAAQREAIHLAYFSELSHTEIARHTGASLGTVKGRLRLAVDRLATAELRASVS